MDALRRDVCVIVKALLRHSGVDHFDTLLDPALALVALGSFSRFVSDGFNLMTKPFDAAFVCSARGCKSWQWHQQSRDVH